MRRGEKLRRCEAGPAEQRNRQCEEKRLNRGRDAKATKFRPIVHEQIAVAKQSGGRSQNLRHQSGSIAPARTQRCDALIFTNQELPSPSPSGNLPNPSAANGQTAPRWLISSTIRSLLRDELRRLTGRAVVSHPKLRNFEADQALVRCSMRILRAVLRPSATRLQQPRATPSQRGASSLRGEF